MEAGGPTPARIRQGMADVKVVKGLLAREARSQFISKASFAVKPSSQLLFFYCAAASVTSLHPPISPSCRVRTALAGTKMTSTMEDYLVLRVTDGT